MQTMTVYRNDTPTLKFTCTYEDTGGAIDLSGAALVLRCKTEDLAATLFTKSDTSFNKAQAVQGIVEVALAAADTAAAAERAVGELEAWFAVSQKRITLCRFRLNIIDDIA